MVLIVSNNGEVIMFERDCKLCGEKVLGEDVGRGMYLGFYCLECSHNWYEDCEAIAIDQARQRGKYER